VTETAAQAAVPRYRRSTTRDDILAVVFGLTGLAIYLAQFLRVLWRIGDEGSILYGAQRVTEGAVPYRDFFEVIGPGAFYWFALWFEAFGTTWVVSRAAILVAALGSAAAIYYIATRYHRGPMAATPAVFYTLLTVPLWPGANHHLDSNLWVLLAAAVFLSDDRLSGRRALAAGVLAGIGSTFIPHKGVLVVLGLSAGTILQTWLGARQWRPLITRLLMLYLGLGLAGATVLVGFWGMGALGDLIYACVTWPSSRYHSVNTLPYGYGLREWFWAGWIQIFSTLTYRPLAWAIAAALLLPPVVVAALPLLAGAAVAHQAMELWRRTTGAAGPPWALWGAAAALAFSESHRPDIYHLIFGSPLLLVAVGLWIRQRSPALTRLPVRVVGACLALLATWQLFTSMGARTPFETRRGTVLLQQPDAALQFIQDNVAPGGDLFVYPYYPMYYFLAGVRNPGRYSILMYHMNSPAEFGEVIEALEARRVQYVLSDTLISGQHLTRFFPTYREPPREEQLMERYFEQHYQEVAVLNRFKILRRTAAPVPPR
jgi:hypothetical protein